MTKRIKAQALTATGFAPYGDVIEPEGAPDKWINQGRCGRFHDRAQLDFSDGLAGLSLFQGQLESLPFKLDMVERHPDGSQAFIPMSADAFLIVVSADQAGQPARPEAFLTRPGQAVNFHRGTWHGVLTPLSGNGLFAVVDRIGPGANLVEHRFDESWLIER